MQKRIAVIYGDGIGKEVITQALKILKAVAKKYEHTFIFEEVLAGGAAIDECGECLPMKSCIRDRQ